MALSTGWSDGYMFAVWLLAIAGAGHGLGWELQTGDAACGNIDTLNLRETTWTDGEGVCCLEEKYAATRSCMSQK
jgi:hypothetical protein